MRGIKNINNPLGLNLEIQQQFSQSQLQQIRHGLKVASDKSNPGMSLHRVLGSLFSHLPLTQTPFSLSTKPQLNFHILHGAQSFP